LHDQAPFTGGCHYAMGCNGFKNGCSKCPQLGDNPWDLTAAALRDKAEAYGGANLTIVTPSRWMGGQAGQSLLLGGFRIEVIPNSLDIDVFRPVPKLEAREVLELPADALYLLLGSYDLKEARKGTRQCMEALRYCLQDPGFQERARVGGIRLLTFGYPHSDLEHIGIPVHALGYLESEESLTMAYAAADVFILPSLEDNLPNTILEAMSCGTAIAAFAAGGIPEMVEEGVTGRLARIGDAEHLAQTIVQLLDSDDRQAMGRACRERVERDYAPHVQAGRYLDLFRELAVDAVDRETGPRLRSGADNVREFEGDETITVPLVAASGPGIEPVYDDLLLPALKKAALRLPMLEEKELILGGRDRIIKDLQQRIVQDKTYIDDLQQRNDDLQQRIVQDKTHINDLQRYIDDRSRRIEQGETQIDDLQQRFERIHEDGLSWLLATATRSQRPYSFLHEQVPGMVTVVIANRDVTAGLERSVRSVWAQNIPAGMLELFVCDDSSFDGTRNVAVSLASKSPVSMQTISYPDRLDRGATAMRDLGMSHAHGEFVALLQPGDVWRPDRLSRQLKYLDEHPDAPCVCSRVDERNPEGRRVQTRRGCYGLDPAEAYDFSPPYTFEQFLHGNPIADSTLLIRRSALIEVGSSPAHLAYPTGMWLQLAKFSLTRPIDSLETPLVDVIVPGGADGNCFPSERAYGEDLEFLLHLLHWMLQHPRHRELGVQVYWEHYPRLMNVRGDAYRLIEDFYRYYGHDGELWEFKEYFGSMSAELVRLRKEIRCVEGVKTVGRWIPGLVWTVRFINSVGRRLGRNRPG
jgi:glycosyltransferase involved in cell wall biosynthesis